MEKNVNILTQQRQNKAIIQGRQADIEQIKVDTYMEIYSKVKTISESILEQYPEEIIAKEKLVKSLYLTGDRDKAKSKGEEFLKTNKKDEIILWYMCKIARAEGNLQLEKQYLEQFLSVTSQQLPIKVSQRLDKVKLLLEKQEEELNQPTFTEEDRQVWIERIQKQFQYGEISLEDIESRKIEAEKYPNYVKSLIDLLQIKSSITEDFQGEKEELNEYLENAESIDKEEYKQILEAMTEIKKKIDEKRIVEDYYRNNRNDERE